MKDPTGLHRLCSARVWGEGTPMVLAKALGIDVSKPKLDASLVCADSNKAIWHVLAGRDREGIEALLAKTDPDVALVMEPTGRYSLEVAKIAREHGRTVLLAPTRKAKAFRDSIQSRAKTDKIDSYALGLFALSQRLPIYPIKAENVETVDQMLTARRGLVDARTKLKMQATELKIAADLIQPAIDALDQQIDAADRAIWNAATNDPEYAAAKQLQKVPGIGKLTAVAMTSCLTSKQFLYPDQFVAFLGLDLMVNDSGMHKGRMRLTKQGNAELRRLLYLSAQANLRCKSSPFKDQYAKERAKGLSHAAATCAVARKIARLCWSLHKHKSSYDPARVGRPPVRVSAQEVATLAN